MSWGSPRTGWPVGVGADLWQSPHYYETEEELRRRHMWDPGRRWEELAQAREGKGAPGWLETLASPFEAMVAPLQYGFGVAQGLVQAGGEALAGRPLPREARWEQHPLGEEEWRLVPEVRNIFDPGEALARYKSITSEPAQFALETMGSFGFGAIPGVAKIGQAGNTALRNTMMAGRGSWEPLQHRAILEGAPTALDRIGVYATGPGARAATLVGGTALGGLAGAEPWDPNVEPQERVGQAAVGFAVGLGLGATAMGAQASAHNIYRLMGHFEPLPVRTDGMVLEPLLQDTLREMGDVQVWKGLAQPMPATAGMAGAPPGTMISPHYPTGLYGSPHANLVAAKIRTKLTDNNAMFSDVTEALHSLEAYESMSLLRRNPGAGAEFDVYARKGITPLPQAILGRGLAGQPIPRFESGIGDWAGPAQANVIGPVQAFRNHGIRYDDQLLWYDKMYELRVAISRRMITEPDPDPNALPGARIANPLDTGQYANSTTDEMWRTYAQMKEAADLTWGPGMGDHMEQMGQEMTAFSNELLRYAANRGGLLSPELAEELVRRHETYGVLKFANTHADDIFRHKELPANPTTPTRKAIGEAWSNTDPEARVEFNTGLQMAQMQNLVKLTRQNEFARSVAKLADDNPNTIGTLIRKWDPEIHMDADGNPVYSWPRQAPKGWKQFRVVENGFEQRYIADDDIAESFRGINIEAADAVTKAMAKFTNHFRHGITVLSIPFIMANVPRDIFHALTNTDLGVDFVRAYTPATMSVITDSLDDWFRMNQGNNVVSRLPQTIWEAYRDHAILPFATGTAAGGAAGAQPWNPNLTPEERAKGAVAGATVGGALGGAVSHGLANRNTEQIRQAYESGLGMSSFVSTTVGDVPAAELLGISKRQSLTDRLKDPVGQFMIPIRNATHAIETMANISEMSTRMAVFRAAMGRGELPSEAALLAREATIDYNKSGTAMRILNLWMPLLNARTQGTLRSARAARDDPFGFAMRQYALTGVPTMLSYAWNRQMFPDLYEQIPLEERMRNHIVVFGSINDAYDRVKPAYVRIPKDQVGAMLSVPLEHVMDAMWHTRHHGQPLTPEQRTDAPTSWTIMRAAGSLLPNDIFPEEMMSPLGWITSAAALNPLANVAMGIKANQDPFRRQPIVPDDQMNLPPEYRYGAQTPTAYKAASHLVSKTLEDMNIDTAGMDWLSPSVMQFTARGVGLALPDYLAQQFDIAVPKLQEIGLIPPGAFVPATVQDLKLPMGTPPEMAQSYLSRLQSEDQRPFWMRLFSRFVGSSARAGSVQERASHLSQREQEIARQTQSFYRDYQDAMAKWRDEVSKLDQAPDITHQEKLDRMQRLGERRQGIFKGLNEHYKLAITNPEQRQAFMAQLPGIGSEWMQAELPKLPNGWTGQKIADYLAAPPGRDMARLNPYQQYAARQQALNALSQQLGQPKNVLETYAGAHKIGAEVPSVPIPNLGIEDALNRYMNPVDQNKRPLDRATTPSHLWRRAQEAVMEEVALEWKLPVDQVQAAIESRFLGSPLELGHDGVSRQRATMLWRRLHDPDRFPQYANPDGSAMGDEAQWAEYDRQLAEAQVRYKGRLPPQYARLDAARKLGEMQRIQAQVTASPELLGNLPPQALSDYTRWYGVGRTMTTRQWGEYMSGAYPRYTQGGPQEWAQWDLMQRMYENTPAGPRKEQMRNQVRRIRALQTPGWRNILQQAQLEQEDVLWEGRE